VNETFIVQQRTRSDETRKGGVTAPKRYATLLRLPVTLLFFADTAFLGAILLQKSGTPSADAARMSSLAEPPRSA